MSAPTRVVYVSADPGVPVFGRKGCSVHVQSVVRALRARGARVRLVTVRTGGDAPADLAGVPLHALPALGGADGPARERAAQAGNAALAAALDGAGPVDLVYERYSLWSFAGMEWARDAGVPGVLEVNAPLIEEQAAHRGLSDRAGALRARARAFAAASAVVCVSEAVAGWARAGGADPARVHVVPNGVDLERFRPPTPGPHSSPATTGDRAVTVGFVGTLKPWHGVETLVAAIARLHHAPAPGAAAVRLLVVGDGPGRAALEIAAERAGIGAVTEWTGALAHAEVPSALARMDIAVAPYPDLPGFYFSPLKLYEYLAAGLAVVASRVGSLDEILEDGVTGVLCPPGDPVALAAAIDGLRRRPERRGALGRAGRIRVAAGGSWDAAVGRILALAARGGIPDRATAAAA